MTPALSTAQNGLTTAAKRYGAASTMVVATAAAASTGIAEGRPAQTVAAAGGGENGAFQNGTFGEGRPGEAGRPALPGGLLALLQEAGTPQGRGRFGAAQTLEQATLDSLQAQRAFEASLKAFQAADRQLGDTLDLLA